MKGDSVQIRRMQEMDIQLIYNGMKEYDIHKPLTYVEQCWEENKATTRHTFIAVYGEKFVGWGHVIRDSSYEYFAQNSIPEIQNFDVIPPYRKYGIGTKLMDEIEDFAFRTYDEIGIGFGLYKDYGAAQTMYVKRGYIPDGNGVSYDGKLCTPGEMVKLDDSLALYLTKKKA